jgi:hypothetical protein
LLFTPISDTLTGMFRYTATTEGTNKLGLREALQNYADGYWHPVGMTAERAAEIALDAFKRQVHSELQLLELKAEFIEGEG